jgi:hypothetical protein
MSAGISVSDARLLSGPLAAGGDAIVVSPSGAIVLAERAKKSGRQLGCAVSEPASSAVERASTSTVDEGSTEGFIWLV